MRILICFLLLLNTLYPQIIRRVAFTDSLENGMIITENNQIHLVFYVNKQGGLYRLKTTNNGLTWSDSLYTGVNFPYFNKFYSIIKTNSNKLYLAYFGPNGIYLRQSSDFGVSWSNAIKIISFLVTNNEIRITETRDSILWITYNRSGKNYFIKSTDGGNSWSSPVIFNTPASSKSLFINSLNDGKYCAIVQDSSSGNKDIYISYSYDNGNTWSNFQPLINSGLDEEAPFFIATSSGKASLIYSVRKPTPFINYFQYDIYFIETIDNGITWSSPKQLTKSVSDDFVLSISNFESIVRVLFKTNRLFISPGSLYYNLALTELNENIDLYPPPHIYSINTSFVQSEVSNHWVINAFIYDETQINKVFLKIGERRIEMYDDGVHGDNFANDFIYGCYLYPEENPFFGIFSINKIILSFNKSGTLADMGVNGNVNFVSEILISDEIQNIYIFNLQTQLRTPSFGIFDNITFLYSGGFYLSGYNNDFLWANGNATSSRILDYRPGKVNSSPNDPKNKIYWIRKTDPPFGQSWQDWRDAVSLGAYFYDGDGDGIYNPIDKNGNGMWDTNEDMPDILGDLTAWTIFNDGVPSIVRRFSDVPPLGLEIRQTIFATNNNPSLRNTIFIRYSILNKGTVSSVFDSVILSIWADPDIGVYWDDLVGTDTLLFSNYSYNFYSDNQYGQNPPSFFITALQLPYYYTGNLSDVVLNRKGRILGQDTLFGFRNANVLSSIMYLQSQGIIGLVDPRNRFELRNYAIGGLYSNGFQIDPCSFPLGLVVGGIDCNQINPRYMFSGDPISNYGWLQSQGRDIRKMLNLGPFKLEQNKPVDVIYAYTVGRGSDYLNSITVAKNFVQQVIAEYNSNFGTITDVNEFAKSLPDKFSLYQNYPNPFNSSTKIRYVVPKEGYVNLIIYDILGRQRKNLINEKQKAGEYEIEFDASKFNLSSGVYFYEIRFNNIKKVGKMIYLK